MAKSRKRNSSALAAADGEPHAQGCPAGLSQCVWQLMNNAPDVVLKLTDGTLPAHSQLIMLWSEPLATAVEALPAAGAGDRVLPLDATVKDWCAVASMLYPVAEPMAMSWDNVEAVAVLADKYNIPGLLQRANTFLTSRIEEMAPYDDSSSSTDSTRLCPSCRFHVSFVSGRCKSCGWMQRAPCKQTDIWEWLRLSDRFGMVQLTAACIDAIARQHRSSATQQRVAALSSRVKDALLLELCKPAPSRSVAKAVVGGGSPEGDKQLRLEAIMALLGAAA